MRQVIRLIREGAMCHAKELGIFLSGGSNARFGEESYEPINIFKRKIVSIEQDWRGNDLEEQKILRGNH